MRIERLREKKEKCSLMLALKERLSCLNLERRGKPQVFSFRRKPENVY